MFTSKLFYIPAEQSDGFTTPTVNIAIIAGSAVGALVIIGLLCLAAFALYRFVLNHLQ